MINPKRKKNVAFFGWLSSMNGFSKQALTHFNSSPKQKRKTEKIVVYIQSVRKVLQQAYGPWRLAGIFSMHLLTKVTLAIPLKIRDKIPKLLIKAMWHSTRDSRQDSCKELVKSSPVSALTPPDLKFLTSMLGMGTILPGHTLQDNYNYSVKVPLLDDVDKIKSQTGISLTVEIRLVVEMTLKICLSSVWAVFLILENHPISSKTSWFGPNRRG